MRFRLCGYPDSFRTSRVFANVNPFLIIFRYCNRFRLPRHWQGSQLDPHRLQLVRHFHFAQAQLLQLLTGAFQKLPVLWRARVQRAVAQRLPHACPLLAETPKICIEIRPGELVPDVILRYFRRMQHIRGVKAVVAQVVYQQLVSREISHARQHVAHNVSSYPQHRLAHRVQRQGIFQMPHGAYRHHKAQLRVDAPQIIVGFGQRVDDFVRGQQFPYEQVGRLLVAVAHQLAGFAQAVGPSRS